MAKLQGILETALYVTDLERSAAFYERVMGFRRQFSDERLIGMAVQEARQVLLLFKEGASTRPSPAHDGLIPPHDGHGTLHLAFAVAAGDLQEWRDKLSAEGVPIESELHTDKGATSIYFRDPDGHLVELASPGLWPNY
jgi:catechol 2,3-dioxygenase-like lactoylglutathione lyase family enzyme